MAYEIGTATDHYDLLAKLRTFLESALPVAERWAAQRGLTGSYGNIVSITQSGTGSSDWAATVTTDIPHLLSPGTNVTISGATDPLYNVTTRATTYIDATRFSYRLSALPAANAAGALVLTRNDHEVIWKAPGLTGSEEIYLGLHTFQDVTLDVYNLRPCGLTGYVASSVFNSQPGISPAYGVPLWNQAMPYWFAGNGQRVIVFVKVQNVYNSFYLGKYFPYATPSQYPYPLLAGAMTPTTNYIKYSDIIYRSWWKGPYAIDVYGTKNVNIAIRFTDGGWRNPECLWQLNTNLTRNTNSNSTAASGYYGLHPVVLSDTSPNVYGEVDGLYYISGYDNAVENTLVVDGLTYVVFRDVFRTGFNDYVALRME